MRLPLVPLLPSHPMYVPRSPTKRGSIKARPIGTPEPVDGRQHMDVQVGGGAGPILQQQLLMGGWLYGATRAEEDGRQGGRAVLVGHGLMT
jgi:hypothetical protein